MKVSVGTYGSDPNNLYILYDDPEDYRLLRWCWASMLAIEHTKYKNSRESLLALLLQMRNNPFKASDK